MNSQKVICVVGPTASGKTALAVELALALDGEVIGADSMQIYRGLDVGTAKPTPAEMRGVPHHMIDVADIGEEYSAARYVQRAGACVDEVLRRGRVPIVAGGTGFYISSLIRGFTFENEEKCDIIEQGKGREERFAAEKRLRERLEALYDRFGGPRLHRLLTARDPGAAAKIHPSDRKRVVRALEVSFAGGRKSDVDALSRLRPPRYDALFLGLTCADRAELYRRIDLRAEQMVEHGILEEARMLRTRGGTAAQAIGYKEFYPALDDPALLGECLERMKQASRRYAKRQLTWFRRQEKVVWFERDRTDFAEIVRSSTEIARAFLYNTETNAGPDSEGSRSLQGRKQAD